MDSIVGIPVGGLGLGAIVSIVILMVLSGKLHTDREYQEKVHEANEWRAESRIKDQQIAEKDAQLRHLAELAPLVETTMRVVQQQGQGFRDPKES